MHGINITEIIYNIPYIQDPVFNGLTLPEQCFCYICNENTFYKTNTPLGWAYGRKCSKITVENEMQYIVSENWNGQ